MSTIHRSRTIVSTIAAVFMVALSAPIAVHAEDELLAEEQALAPASIPGPSVSVEDSRVSAAQHALLSPDLGSMQEEALFAIVAAAPSWDETSGYGVLEASRATIGHPAFTTTETSRLATAQQALLSGDLGSMQEEDLAAVVAASSTGDDTSVDEALASTRAALLAQFRAVELSSSRYLGADQHLSSCAAAS